MLTKADVLDCSLGLLIVSDDDGSVVMTGTIREFNDELHFEHNDGVPAAFPLPADALERIRRIDRENAEVRAILGGADFVLTLTAGRRPEGTSLEGAIPTGLTWPRD